MSHGPGPDARGGSYAKRNEAKPRMHTTIDRMKVITGAALAILGAAFVVYGGYDDSPGAQFLGLFVVALGIRRMVRARGRANGDAAATRARTGAKYGGDDEAGEV